MISEAFRPGVTVFVNAIAGMVFISEYKVAGSVISR